MTGNLGSTRLKIDTVHQTGNYTLLTWDGNNQIRLRPYIYIKPGDVLEFTPSLDSYKEISKIITDKSTSVIKRIKLYPAYHSTETIHIPPHKFRVTFRERLNPSDLRATKALAQFHYRGKGLNKIVGRRSLLVAECDKFGIVGFGVLSATVAAAKPRFELFNTNFTAQMKTRLINQIVRIPRVVVHPEFRGIGLGVAIVKHLIRYAKEYWDINHYSPILIEVIAAMTEYHRFFETAGFVKLGYTSGYRRGIIPQYGGNSSFERRFNYQSYDFLQNQKPKPYLAFPLTPSIKQKIKEAHGKSVNPNKMKKIGEIKLKEPIRFEKVSVIYKANNGITDRSLLIKESFGVDSTQLSSLVIRDLTLTIEPGEVVLITGASGTGKSTLLKLFTNDVDQMKQEMIITGRIAGLDLGEVAILCAKFDDSLPLIDQVKIGKDIREAIELLNGVGLAEAHLYLKRPFQISDGQRYRFAVAKLCDSDKPIWLADEFVSTLNPETAAIVAKGLRRIAWKSGATLILTAPHTNNFIQSLLPTKLIRLKWGGEAVVYSTRLVHGYNKELWELTVINTCALPLTGVEIQAVNATGRSKCISKMGAISPRDKIVIKIEKGKLKNYRSITVRSAENVGDVIYLS